ncbi:hypothetical protein BHE74_00003433 [Ensete ventricosum]|nr:hypothetical protein BHE74_00003433 [Ensete ventricosum]
MASSTARYIYERQRTFLGQAVFLRLVPFVSFAAPKDTLGGGAAAATAAAMAVGLGSPFFIGGFDPFFSCPVPFSHAFLCLRYVVIVPGRTRGSPRGRRAQEEDVSLNSVVSSFFFSLALFLFLSNFDFTRLDAWKGRSLREEGLVRHQGPLGVQREEYREHPCLEDSGHQGLLFPQLYLIHHVGFVSLTSRLVAVMIFLATQIASEGLKHRVFEVCLADLQNDEDQAHRKIRLRAEDVQGKNVLTNFWVCALCCCP